MSSKKLTYKGGYSIVHNGRDVEMDLVACAYSWYQKGTRDEPEDWGLDVDDYTITNAHYVDTDEPVSEKEIEDEVCSSLKNEDDYFWGNFEEDDADSSGFDCVDRWKYQHGIEF